MPEATQVGPVVTVGRLAFDFGPANQQMAWQFLQLLKNRNVVIAIDGEPL